MAAALAGKMLGDRVQAESAGVDVGEQSARELAITVMHECFGLDIGSHRPRDVEEVSVNDFDYVIAMKPFIAADLMDRFHLPPGKVITWNIDDPAAGGLDEYRRCVKRISLTLNSLAGRLNL